MAFLFLDSLPRSNSRLLQISIKALEVVLLSTGLISTILMIVKGAVVPYSCEIVFSSLMGFWNSIKCFLSHPLYICIMINSMVVLIAISSTFHRRESENQDYYDGNIEVNFDDMQISESPPPAPPPSPPLRDVAEVAPPPQNATMEEAAPPPPVPLPRTKTSTTSTTSSSTCTQQNGIENSSLLISSATANLLPYPQIGKEANEEEEDTIEATWNAIIGGEKQKPKRKHLKKSETWNLQPPLLPRTKNSTTSTTIASSSACTEQNGIENSALFSSSTSNLLPNYPQNGKEAKEEEEGTIEATWNAIIGGEKQKPKRKHLKKSETWNLQQPAVEVRRLDSEELLPSTPKWKELRKSETFNDAVSMTRRGGLRRDPSMSIDEFNKQVEAFINKFNNDMRLQRQESDQRFMDMIKRGL